MFELMSGAWPWYVAGPLIGLVVPLLLWVGGEFGVSENLRHLCAALLPAPNDFFRYDWKTTGLWNLAFALGISLGGAVAGTALASPDPLVISAATLADLEGLELETFSGWAPAEVFSWAGLATTRGLIMIVVGGFLVGFGARYAGGCTSGHAISGLANLQPASLLAVLGFFAGGLVATWFLLPFLI